MTVADAIDMAEQILPGAAAPDRTIDPRWQAIIHVGDFIESHPDEVWAFAAKWGCGDDEDLQTAVATCLVEHLLEHHFDKLFPKVEALALDDPRFARVVSQCWTLGEAEIPSNAARLQRLIRELQSRQTGG